MVWCAEGNRRWGPEALRGLGGSPQRGGRLMNRARRVRVALALTALGLRVLPPLVRRRRSSGDTGGPECHRRPAKVVGGNTVTGTVTLNRAPDARIEIFVSDSLDNDRGGHSWRAAPSRSRRRPLPARSPSPPPRWTGTFRTALTALKGDGTSTVTPSATLHIVPTAETDLITVVKATLSKSAKLTVVADSDDPSATLTAYLNDDPLGVLSNGRGTFQLPSVTSGIVQVRSDLGGCGQRSFPNGNGSSPC